MPITRHGPVINMDTEQVLRMPPSNQRITRSVISRILVRHNIHHDRTASKEKLLEILRANDIPLEPVPPGPVSTAQIIDIADEEDIDRQIAILIARKKEKEGEFGHKAKDGYPAHIGMLKKLCKIKGIKMDPHDKRDILIARLEALNV